MLCCSSFNYIHTSFGMGRVTPIDPPTKLNSSASNGEKKFHSGFSSKGRKLTLMVEASRTGGGSSPSAAGATVSPAADGARSLPGARLPDDGDGPVGGGVAVITSASVRPVLLPMLLSERARAAFAFVLVEAGGGDLEDEDDRRRRNSSLGDFIVRLIRLPVCGARDDADACVDGHIE